MLRKPNFLFGDSVNEDAEVMYDGSYKWLRQLGERHFFLPDMERMFSLSSIQSMSFHRSMKWKLTKEQSEVSLGQISHHAALGRARQECSWVAIGVIEGRLSDRETPHQATSFINQFMVIKGDFLKGKF